VLETEQAWTVPDVYLLTDGAEGRVAVPRRQQRCVLATDDPGSTEAPIRERSVARGLRVNSDRAALSRDLTVSIAVATAAATAVLLLSAVHLIHF